jgi:glycosyltransferase involved in cell wall biosynthesis
MRVVVIAATDSSGHYRLRQPIAELQRQGVDAEFLLPSRGLELELGDAGLRDVRPRGQLYIFQRPMTAIMPTAIDLLRRRGAKVIVELDDDFHTAHPQNQAFRENHPRRSPLANWRWLAECVRRCDLVTVSTPQLAQRYGSHGRVALLRNYADDWWLELPSRANGHTLGWAGTTVNHPLDLPATRGGVAMALADHPDWSFLCVGGGEHIDEIRQQLQITNGTSVQSTPWKPLDLHPLAVGSISLGIAPLDLTLFNQAKTALKGLEYSALGIPFVASDTGEYRWLHAQGIGVRPVRSKARSWRRALGEFMRRPDLRAALGQSARQIVRQSLTIRSNAWRWLEVWTDLVEHG